MNDIDAIETVHDFIFYGRYYLRRADTPGGVWETKFPRGLVDIELYLRSLWRLIVANRHTPLTWRLMAALLDQAYETEPGAYDPAWSGYRQRTAGNKAVDFTTGMI